MGGAQPLAATLNGAAFLGIDVDPERIKRRVKTGYCDVMVNDLDEALRILKNAVRKARSDVRRTGGKLRGRDSGARAPRRGSRSAHRPNERARSDRRLHSAGARRGASGGTAQERSRRRIASVRSNRWPSTWKECSRLQKLGSVTFDYGNNIRTFAFEQGVKNAYDFPGFVPAYIRPLFCEGRGPFRWAALSGEPSDIHRTDQLVLEMFPHDEILSRWIKLAQKRVRFQGLAGADLLAGLWRARQVWTRALNDLVARGELKAPIVIGRDHLDCGSVASPYRETEKMRDGSDAVADWPLLNALLNTASGASWVSIHNGGGVGIGYSLHAGQVTVADGTKEMAARIERVLTNDPGIGVARHVDAGYPEAIDFAKKSGVKVPMM